MFTVYQVLEPKASGRSLRFCVGAEEFDTLRQAQDYIKQLKAIKPKRRKRR